MSDLCRPGSVPVRLDVGRYASTSQDLDADTVKELRKAADPIGQALADMRLSASNRRFKRVPVTQPSTTSIKGQKWIAGPFDLNSGNRLVIGPGGQTVPVEVIGNGPSEPGSPSRIILGPDGKPIALQPKPKGPDRKQDEEEQPQEVFEIGTIKAFFLKIEYFVNGVRVANPGFGDYQTRFSIWLGGDRDEPVEIWFKEQTRYDSEGFKLVRVYPESTGQGLDDWSVFSDSRATLSDEFPFTNKQKVEYLANTDKATGWVYEATHEQDYYDFTNRDNGSLPDLLDYYGYGLVIATKGISWLGDFEGEVWVSEAGYSLDFSTYSVINFAGNLNYGISFSASEPLGYTGLIVNGNWQQHAIGNLRGGASWSHNPTDSNLSTWGSSLSVGIPGIGFGNFDNGAGLTFTSPSFNGTIDPYYRPVLPDVFYEQKEYGSSSGMQGPGGREWHFTQVYSYVQAVNSKLSQASLIRYEREVQFNTDNASNSTNSERQNWKWQLYDKTTDTYTTYQELEIVNVSDTENYNSFTGTITKCEPVPFYEVGSESSIFYETEFDTLAPRFFQIFGSYGPETVVYNPYPFDGWFGEFFFNQEYADQRNYLATLADSKFYQVSLPDEITWEEIYTNGGELIVNVYSIPLQPDLSPAETFKQRVEPVKLEDVEWETGHYLEGLFKARFLGYKFIPDY